MRLRLLVMIVAAALAVPSVASAQQAAETDRANDVQEDELVTDRPSFTESSSTVPTGRLQLEAGLGYTYFDMLDGLHAFDGPNLLARVGLADFAELRLGAPNVLYTELGDDLTETNFGEASLGAKFATALADQIRVGVISFVEIGVDDADMGGGLIGTFAYDVTADLGVAVNAGLTGAQNPADEFDLEGSVSLTAAYGITDKLGVFLESYVLIPEDDTDFFVDTGVTYLVAPLVQLDAFVGTDVPDADAIFGGAGISVLF
ncbi:MAG: transporter [Persicimonas sp.]